MHKQLLAIMVATMLALAVAFISPIQIAIAQEEIPEHEHDAATAFEVLTDIVHEEAGEVVEDIIKDDPVLTDTVETTAEEVAATDEVKPELIEAVNDLTDAVSETGTDPTDVIPELDNSTTTTEVLVTLGGLEDTQILEVATTDVATIDVVATDESFQEAVNVEICNTIDAIIANGTSIEAAVEDFQENIGDIAEAEITEEEVTEAVNNVESTDVIEAVDTGEVDLGDSAGEAAADELEVVITPTPEPEPEPTTDNGHGNKDDHATIIAQNAEIIELLKTQNSLLEQFLAAQ